MHNQQKQCSHHNAPEPVSKQVPRNHHFIKQEQQSKSKIQIEKFIWTTRCKYMDTLDSHHNSDQNNQLCIIRKQYRSECLDALIRARLLFQSQQQIQKEIKDWINILEMIDKIFMEWHFALQIDTGQDIENLKVWWKKLMNILWVQVTSCSYETLNKFYSKEWEGIKNLLSTFFESQKPPQNSQSPIFSEQQAAEESPKKRKRQRDKYNRFNLCQLLSESHIEKMKKQLQILENQQTRNRLMKNLEEVLGKNSKELIQ